MPELRKEDETAVCSCPFCVYKTFGLFVQKQDGGCNEKKRISEKGNSGAI